MALNEYSTWQTLSPHEALSKVNVIRSNLQSASRAIPSVSDVPNPLSTITFEMPSVSVLSSLEHLGRLRVERSTSSVALPDDTSTSWRSLLDGTEPPAKKRKES